MAGYGTAELKAGKSMRPCINTCGACDAEVGRGEALCQDCKNEVLYGIISMGKVTAHSGSGQ